jgi:hypothetical protein
MDSKKRAVPSRGCFATNRGELQRQEQRRPAAAGYRVQQQRTPDGGWCIPTGAFYAAFCEAGSPRLLHASRPHPETKKRQRVSSAAAATDSSSCSSSSSSSSTTTTTTTNRRRLAALQSLFSTRVRLTPDADSWAVERDTGSTDAAAFLDPSSSPIGYCSFILQDSDNIAAFLTSSDLHFGGKLPVATQANLSLSQTQAVWTFVGRNDADVATHALRGRPEHTDAVPHDCTWHEQVDGTKTWHLRPTDSLAKVSEVAKRGVGGVDIHVHDGDIIIVDTKAWWHCTSVPSQPGISMSYARDLYVNRPAPGESDMVNLDGVWAQKSISAGEVVFTEHDLPDAELQRGSNPNCELVELQGDEDGTSCMAVMTTQSVKAGEFFVLAEDSTESTDDAEPTDEESE